MRSARNPYTLSAYPHNEVRVDVEGVKRDVASGACGGGSKVQDPHPRDPVDHSEAELALHKRQPFPGAAANDNPFSLVRIERVLNLKTTTSHKSSAVPRRARI